MSLLKENFSETNVMQEVKRCDDLGVDDYIKDANERIKRNNTNDKHWVKNSSTCYIVYQEKYLPIKAIMRMARFNKTKKMSEGGTSHEFVKLVNSGMFGEEIKAEVMFKATDPKSITPEGEQTYHRVLTRKAQADFRKSVFGLHKARCVLTNCDVEQALEAAHIIHFADEPNNNNATNGIPLRRDVHRLFDLNMIKIDPDNFEVSSTLPNKYDGLMRVANINIDLTSKKAIQENLKTRYLNFLK